jgi:hypothetical protein
MELQLTGNSRQAISYTRMIMDEHASLQSLGRRFCAETAAVVVTCVLGVLLYAAQPLLTPAAPARPSQYDVEAAYLLDLGKFMHLGPGSQALRRNTFDICILGRDLMGQTVNDLAAHNSIDGQAVRILRETDAVDARTCAIAFISSHDELTIRDALSSLAGADVLTVGDAPDFLEEGGMIQFVLQKDHVRFAVNLNAVEKTHIVLSSELLRVALAVNGKPPQTGGAP